MEVMSTGTKGLQTYIMNRLLVYMYREFRAGEKRGSLPCIRADELSAQFPNISESFLRKRLKHCADLQVRLAYGSISGICYFFFFDTQGTFHGQALRTLHGGPNLKVLTAPATTSTR